MMALFDSLLDRFLRDELDPSELKLFLKMVKQPEYQDRLREALEEKLQGEINPRSSGETRLTEMFEQMLEKASAQPAERDEPEMISLEQRRRPFPWMRVAAALMLIIGGAAMYLGSKRDPQPHLAMRKKAVATEADIAPGGNKAVLTLSDGSEIILDGSSNGLLTRQGNTKVVKLANGQLAYQLLGSASTEMVYNTMTTPRGGQYRLTLPDGTQVWLNATSSITYPTTFSGNDRKVKLKGEAYFEVPPNHHKPFTVQVNGMDVQVLGTDFNVNAYDDETTVKTTLVAGAVSITKNAATLLLKPGQQAQLEKSGDIKLVEGADIEGSVAWKNGLFSFRGADVTAIMRQLARWYDLDVKYDGEISRKRFSGQVFRNLNLSEALKVLELSGVHFRIEGKQLTVL